MIYTQANPMRTAEIWQYVYTINTAASSYIWENVASYDTTFRHLMAQYPGRSWAKIYNQMWNLAMRDPIQRGTFQSQTFKSGGNYQNQGNATSNGTPGQAGGKAKRPNYCWSFNRGQCKGGSNGAKCKFVDRCSFCDAGDHGKNTCQKAKEAGPPLQNK